MHLTNLLNDLIKQAGRLQKRKTAFHGKFILVYSYSKSIAKPGDKRVVLFFLGRCIRTRRMYRPGFAICITLEPMKCKLCEREVRLVASHIIPEFLYQTLYDSKHRFHQISADPSGQNQYKQKGLRETLLCEACEQHLSVPEQYMCRLLNGDIPATIVNKAGYIHLSGLDYPKLKLFQLSVLWRAGVSSLAPFSQVQLGPHEPRLRSMLLSDEPGLAADYGCIMATLMDGSELLTGIVAAPTWARLAGLMAYRFVFGGIVFVFVVSSTTPPRAVVDAFARPDGSALVKLQQASEMKFLVDTVAKMHKLGRFADE